jgi:S-layer protein
VVLSAGAAVTTIDGSAMTGKLTATSNTVATTITGGSGADSLTASVNGSTLVGGAGGDTLIASANLVTLTGGTGADTFDVSYVVSNLNSYATITDFSAGDKLKVGGTGADVAFISAKITLASTASFADYANAAAAAAGADDVAWFQFGGDTYLVQDRGADSLAADGFINGQDTIVKLAGTIDLSLLTFNSTALTFA